MLKVHRYSSIFTPGRLRRHQEAGDAARVAVLAAGAREQRAMGRDMHAGGPHLLAVDAPAGDAVAVSRTARVSMWVASEPCSGSVRPKAMRILPVIEPSIIVLLVVGAEIVEHHHERKIADDRMLVLQVVVQAQPLGGEMLADHRHPEIGAVLAAVALRAARSADARRCRRDSSPLRSSASHSCRGRPPLSKSVRAHSRR